MGMDVEYAFGQVSCRAQHNVYPKKIEKRAEAKACARSEKGRTSSRSPAARRRTTISQVTVWDGRKQAPQSRGQCTYCVVVDSHARRVWQIPLAYLCRDARQWGERVYMRKHDTRRAKCDMLHSGGVRID